MENESTVKKLVACKVIVKGTPATIFIARTPVPYRRELPTPLPKPGPMALLDKAEFVMTTLEASFIVTVDSYR